MDNNITMVRGDTASFGIKFKDHPEISLSGAYLVVRSDFDTSALFVKRMNDGISRVGAGEYTVRIAPSDTADLNEGTYVYDFKISINGDLFTLLRGLFIILPRVGHIALS